MYCKFHIGQRQSQWTNWHNDNELKVSEHLHPSRQNVIKNLKGSLETWATYVLTQALYDSSADTEIFDFAKGQRAFGKLFQVDDKGDYSDDGD